MALRMLELIAALAHTCTAQWTKLTPAAAPSARTVAAFAQVRVRALATHGGWSSLQQGQRARD
jgi:hypothetical protein